MKHRKQLLGIIAVLAAFAVYWQVPQASESAQTTAPPSRANERAPESSPAPAPKLDLGTPNSENIQVELSSFVDAVAARKSKQWMTVTVRVRATLPDDNDGSRHQRFIAEGRDGNTVLVAHNIDLALSVPLKKRDVLEIRGRYEWNEKGGVLHWTHSDPAGRNEGGWIRHRGKTYR